MNEFKRQEVRMPGDTGEWDGNLPQGTPPNQPTRRGSVTFREAGDATDAASMLDPANQSLAEALNILLKLLYVGVAALFVAYLISGFKFVKEGERGIRLLFGRVEDSSLEPGFRWKNRCGCFLSPLTTMGKLSGFPKMTKSFPPRCRPKPNRG